MQKNNKTIVSQIISGGLKFLVAVVAFIIVIIIITSFLSIIKGKDIPPVDDSNLKLQTINLPEEENAFYDLNKLYDTEKHQELVSLKNIPKGKQLVSDYLNSDEWNQEVVTQLLTDNEYGLQYFTDAAAKGVFQLPEADSQSKISSDMPVTAMNTWREISRLSGVKAIWLAKNGKNKEALGEAFKSIIVGSAIENSQGLLITHLVGIGIKDGGLDILQKVISIISKDSLILADYKLKLENYQAKGNSAPFITEYLISKQALDNLEQGRNNPFGIISKILIKNKFYFKKNLTISYYFDFYNKLAVESGKDCSEVKKVQGLVAPLEEGNLIKMYFTENLVGKYYVEIPELALNNVLEKKCATENKLKETILIIDGGKNKILVNNPSQIYHEIETTLKSEIVDDVVNFSTLIPKEIALLQKRGEIFWYDQNHKIQGRAPMCRLRSKIECKNGGKEDCSIIGLQAYKNNLPPDFIIEECDSYGWCPISEPEFQENLVNNIKKTVEFYGFGKDIYTVGSVNGDDNYSIFKNDKEIFSHKMYFGAESVIEDESIVLGLPAFTFYGLKEWKDENTPIVSRNIWYNNETINEKFAVDVSSYLFSYQDKIGFVGEKDGKNFIFFNGQKISQDFDEIRTNSCCATFAYPIELDENGILFFLAKRGEKYFFVEINLNEVLL